MTSFTIIAQNPKALIEKPEGLNSYEVWIRVERSTSKNKGELILPGPEDFGVWAWAVYSLWKADWLFQEITSGRRGFRPMLEANDYDNPNPDFGLVSKVFSRTFNAAPSGRILNRRFPKPRQRARK